MEVVLNFVMIGNGGIYITPIPWPSNQISTFKNEAMNSDQRTSIG
jgi:hypothetical protein